MARPKKARTETAPAVAEKQEEKKVEQMQIKKEFLLQAGGEQWDLSNIEDRVTAAYVAEGHRKSAIKQLSVYVKPEERKIYYVVNDKTSGSIDL